MWNFKKAGWNFVSINLHIPWIWRCGRGLAVICEELSVLVLPKKLVGLEAPKPTKCPVGLPTFKMASSNTYQHRGASWTPQWLLICWGDSMRLEILTEKWFRISALLTWKLTSRRQGKESSKPVKFHSSFLSHYIDQSNHRAHAGSWGWRNRALIESRGETL